MSTTFSTRSLFTFFLSSKTLLGGARLRLTNSSSQSLQLWIETDIEGLLYSLYSYSATSTDPRALSFTLGGRMPLLHVAASHPFDSPVYIHLSPRFILSLQHSSYRLLHPLSRLGALPLAPPVRPPTHRQHDARSQFEERRIDAQGKIESVCVVPSPSKFHSGAQGLSAE